MTILANAEAHFRSRLGGELRSLDVPEWGEDGTPLKIYFKSLINFKAQEKIYSLVNEGKSSEAVCQTLIIRALDEDGKHLFTDRDKEKLMRFVDPEVVARIVSAMTPDDEDDLDSLKKS